jgi:hypothetical protein
MAGSIIREPISHRHFCCNPLRVCFVEVIATLGPSCSVIIGGLMIGID